MPLAGHRLAVHRARPLILLLAISLLAVISSPAQTAATSQPGSTPAGNVLLGPIASGSTLDRIDSVNALRDGIDLQSGTVKLRITALRDDIIRVRISLGPLPEDASWAVLSAARGKSVGVKPIKEPTAFGFRTAALEVSVERSPVRLVIRDLAGNVISADALGRPIRFQLGGFTVSKQMPADEHYFGLGDKSGSFDRRNQSFTLWNTDVAPQESIDPLYKAIPFFLATNGTRSYGLFLDNAWRTWFDFGKQSRDAISFGSDSGPLDYYIIYGPSPKQVVEGYAYLTGKPPLPPLWALGFQQSRYSYTPESQVRDIADRLRADKIPTDVLYLDIDYQDRNRPFTVNAQTFPNFPGLVSDLRHDHFHLVTITDLHIAHAPNQNYFPYDSGHSGDHFVKNPDGTEFVGIVWPGPAVFPDFTRAPTREWWGSLYKNFVADGVAGFWNDMNEPSVFGGPGGTMPLDTVHRIQDDESGFAPRSATHAEIHNIVGLENARATYEGLLKLRPNERPFVLTRATYAGGQRYGFTWTGDNSATWNHLRLATQMVLNLGVSGISLVGADIGGFNGSPSSDLLTRWVEMAAFTPLCRDHSSKDSKPHELWVNGPEQEAIRRRYIETRYRLLPYIYSLADDSSRTGLPMMRPVFLEFPEIISTGGEHYDTEFLLGPSLLVAPPPFGEMQDGYAVGLPQAAPWFDFWTGLKMPRVPIAPPIAEIVTATAPLKFPEQIHPPLDTMPVYVRGGSIVPLQPLVQSTDEVPHGPLELDVYPGPNCRGALYLDDGHTFAYQQGDFLRQALTCESEADSVEVKFSAREGTYAPWWKSIEIVIYDWPSPKAEAKLSTAAAPLKTSYDAKKRALHVTIADAPESELTVTSH